MLARIWSNRNTYSLLVRKQTGTATLQGSLVGFYKTKPIHIVWSSNSTRWCIPKGDKNIFTQKPALKCWSFLIHNCWKLKDEKTFVNLYNRILVSYKKKIIISCQATKRRGIKLTRALWSSWTQAPLCPPTLVCREKKNSSKVFMSCILKYKLK